MRRFFAKKGNAYINYISLHSHPIRLSDTYYRKTPMSFKTMKNIIYTKKEIDLLIKIDPDLQIIEVES